MKERNMDREELVESSSSQNVSITVRAVQRGARGKDICLFSDGSSFLLPPGFAKKHNLLPGITLSYGEARVIKHQAAYVSVMRKALEYLAEREYTVQQLHHKLVRKGYSEEIIQEALARLQEEGSLDEDRFCRSWIISRLKKHPEGSVKLKAGLIKAGIKRAMAEKYLAEMYPEDEELRMLERAAEKLERTGTLEKEKFIKKLCSRGFSYRQVLYYIENIH